MQENQMWRIEGGVYWLVPEAARACSDIWWLNGTALFSILDGTAKAYSLMLSSPNRAFGT